jgi:FtsP/CotA-like multicopper oxidase with cupredoxin domain
LLGSLALLGILMVVASAMGAAAEPADQELKNPPVIGRVPTGPGGALEPVPQEVSVALSIAYRDGQLWNPDTHRYDAVRLRSYANGNVASGSIGPTIVARPGDTLRLGLANNLPADDPSCGGREDHNVPACFNTTNLHTHGFWVSPGGSSDNIFLALNPGVSLEYEFLIPADHPAGTFWYHPHYHGSTALQVSSGLAGALILRGDRMPSVDQPGDLDVLLRGTDGQPFEERILVFQQIAYACRDQAGRIKTEPADDDQGLWVCDEGDVGEIERYLGPVPPNQFGGGSWVWSGRHTSINGDVLGTLRGSKAGRFERWRMIHAGVRDTLSLQIRKMNTEAAAPENLSAAETSDYVARHCRGPTVPLFLVAADGLTMDQAREVSNAVMQPGYRWDALVAFPEPGRYCLIDDIDAVGGGLQGAAPIGTRLLGTIEVDDGAAVAGTAADALTAALITSARANLPDAGLPPILADLEQDLGLSAFVPHTSLLDAAVDGNQEVVYNIDLTTNPVSYEVNGMPFDAGNVRRLPLGHVEDWYLSSSWEGHPHHIHTNPFQVIEVLDPNGKDVSAPGAVDDFTGQVDSQFAGMKGVWKDTIWVKNPAKSPDDTYTIRIRAQYRRYLGRAVLHCHILDHEDQGMMQTIEFVLPDQASRFEPDRSFAGRVWDQVIELAGFDPPRHPSGAGPGFDPQASICRAAPESVVASDPPRPEVVNAKAGPSVGLTPVSQPAAELLR